MNATSFQQDGARPHTSMLWFLYDVFPDIHVLFGEGLSCAPTALDPNPMAVFCGIV
jgi:hypothetical protein